MLDHFDRRILEELQKDARLTNGDLSERINLSPSQCSRRRIRLEEDGYIAGYYAGLDLSMAQQSPIHYAFDIIRNHCPTATSGPEAPQWNDVTGAGGAVQGQVNRWKYPR